MMLLRATYVELLKLRRTSMVWILPLAYGVGPLVAFLFMVILKNPEIGARLGLLEAKAALAGASPDWPSYLGMVRMMGAGGMVVIGMISTFVFGREYTEGTAKIILSLPVHRSSIVAAKFLVCALWYVAISVWIYAEAFVLGVLARIPGYSAELARETLAVGIRLVPEMLLLVTIPAWVAVASKGYLGPMGFIIFSLVLATILQATGWAPWFPWSIILLECAVGPNVSILGIGSRVVLTLSCVAGWILTWRTLDRADNLQ